MRLFLLGFILLFCFTIKTKAQNLVPNPSFEYNINCTNIYIENSLGWCAINNGVGAGYYQGCQSNQLFMTPYQYLDACFTSYQVPRTGVAYIDIGTYVLSATQESSVPQVKLIDTLKAGKIYCVTYYVSVWNNAKYTIDKLGALLTQTPFPCFVAGGPTVAIAGNYTPQVVTTPGVAIGDTLNWTEVSGSFTAVGNEAYLAIGNFFTHAQHYIQNTYPTNCNGLVDYYVDDVSVEEVQIAKAKNDTLIMQGDSATIGLNNSEAALFSWQPSAGLSCTSCPNPKASPAVTTTYTVTKTQCKSVTSDVITVTVSPVGINELVNANVFKISPNPATDVLNIEFIGHPELVSGSHEMLKQVQYDYKIKITDVLGKELVLTDYQKQIDISYLETGIYFVSILQGNKSLVTKKVVKQ